MNFFNLAYYPNAVVGETRRSWLDHAEKGSLLEPRLWHLWTGSPCSVDEPERGRFPDGSEWSGFPLITGDIRSVPPFWRICGDFRNARCEVCEEELGRLGERFELVDWCDARCLFCQRHELPLTYGSLGCREWAKLCSSKEISVVPFRSWLDAWRASQLSRDQGRLRRDLVIMAMRNWSGVPSVGVGAALGWWLRECGWTISASHHLQAPYKPTRLGYLCAMERIGSLYCAFQWHEQLRLGGSIQRRFLSDSAITWFERRWPGLSV